MRADRALGATLAVLAALFLLFGVGTIPDDWQTQTGAQFFVVGPGLFPYIAGILVLLLALLLVVRPDGRHAVHELKEEPCAGVRVAALLLICGGYILLIDLAGFRIATSAMIASFLLTFGLRRPLPIAGFALGVALGVAFVFERLFGISMPEPALQALGL